MVDSSGVQPSIRCFNLTEPEYPFCLFVDILSYRSIRFFSALGGNKRQLSAECSVNRAAVLTQLVMGQSQGSDNQSVRRPFWHTLPPLLSSESFPLWPRLILYHLIAQALPTCKSDTSFCSLTVRLHLSNSIWCSRPRRFVFGKRIEQVTMDLLYIRHTY